MDNNEVSKDYPLGPETQTDIELHQLEPKQGESTETNGSLTPYRPSKPRRVVIKAKEVKDAG